MSIDGGWADRSREKRRRQRKRRRELMNLRARFRFGPSFMNMDPRRRCVHPGGRHAMPLSWVRRDGRWQIVCDRHLRQAARLPGAEVIGPAPRRAITGFEHPDPLERAAAWFSFIGSRVALEPLRPAFWFLRQLMKGADAVRWAAEKLRLGWLLEILERDADHVG